MLLPPNKVMVGCGGKTAETPNDLLQQDKLELRGSLPRCQSEQQAIGQLLFFNAPPPYHPLTRIRPACPRPAGCRQGSRPHSYFSKWMQKYLFSQPHELRGCTHCTW